MNGALLASLRDKWQRLRPPVRWGLGGLLLAIAIGVALTLRSPHPAASTATISVHLSGPPAAAKAATIGADGLRAQLNDRAPLTAAPRDDFLATAPEGRVPRKDPTGAAVWQAYARPAPALPASTPRLAVLITEVGLPTSSPKAVFDLPSAVTLAVASTAADPAGLIAAARAAGHEAAFDLPLSPVEAGDLGPDALRWDDATPDALHKLRLWLARSPGAFALLSQNGAGFTGNRHAMTPLLQDVALRGLGWIAVSANSAESLAIARTLSVPVTQGTVSLDDVANADAIKAAFQAAIVQARHDGSLLVVAHAYPVTLQTLADLLPTLPDAGVALVPVSSLLTIKAAHE